ncbi:folate-binding protein YgfZ [soil metagenome]
MSTDAFTSRPGAVGSPPQHYGNPLGEQQALARGEAIVDLADRGVVTVTGPDRLSWLDSLTSQSLKGLQPGESAETLLLDPTGRLEHAMRVVDDGETAWLLVDGGEAAPLAAWLDRMRFMLRVEVAVRSADFLTIGALGQFDLPAVVTWIDPWNEVTAGGHQYALHRPAAPWDYHETVVARDADLSAFPAAGTLALEALRIAAWRPRLSTEADDRSIPHELDWLRSAVHLNKGCYRGQETVAKVHNLGHPPRRLVMLHLDGVVPAAGSEVLSGETVVGSVTSAALHYELGPIALAVIKRNVDPGIDLVVPVDGESVAAAQEVIVPTDAGAEANVPRLPRLGSVTR